MNNNSVLTYCCRNKYYDAIKTLSIIDNLDVFIFNNEEKTAIMYLMEDERCLERRYLSDKNMDYYFKSSKGE